MRIWAQTLVKNEEKYVWYAVTSVVDHVDKVMLWDTGSTDKTPEIIGELIKKYPGKIEFKEVGEVDPLRFTEIRQQMLNEMEDDWLLIVDGDEIWWEDSIKELTLFIRESGIEYESIISPNYNIVGDIYHYQEESAGRYQIDGRVGHVNIRATSLKIPGLHFDKPHGSLGLFDGNGKLIQERDKKKRAFINAPYMHFTNMIRSSNREYDLLVPKRKIKLKYEIGNSFPKDFYYPEAFFKPRPDSIESPWKIMTPSFETRAFIETPLRKIKRRIWQGKAGY
jgi:hypothetical protein